MGNRGEADTDGIGVDEGAAISDLHIRLQQRLDERVLSHLASFYLAVARVAWETAAAGVKRPLHVVEAFDEGSLWMLALHDADIVGGNVFSKLSCGIEPLIWPTGMLPAALVVKLRRAFSTVNVMWDVPIASSMST